MTERRFKFAHVNEWTGVLVLGVLALVLAGVVLSGHSQRWFTHKYAFDVLLPEEGALGLRRGNEVLILGVSVGLVDGVSVETDGRMTARVEIQRDFQRFVRADSTATIKKVFGLAGDSFMEITRGSGPALPLHKPVVVCLSTEDSLGRMEKLLDDLHAELVPVVKKAGTAFDEWSRVGGDLQTDGQQLHQFVARLDNMAAGVEQGKGAAGKLLTDTALVDQAQKVLVRADEAVGQLEGVVATLGAAATNVQHGTARLPEITDAVANEARDLPGLVQQTQISMRELERLIEALQHNWLVRRYVNKTNPPPARLSDASQEPPSTWAKALRTPKESTQ